MSKPARPPRWALAIGAAVALAAITMLIIWLAGDRFEYDETAHRNVVEAYTGGVADWDAYRDATLDACEFDEETFELYVLMSDDLSLLQLDIQYACPDRMDEFTDITGMAPLD